MNRFKTYLVFTIFSLLVLNGFANDGFLKTEGQKIVDANGQNIVLRGMGLGGWMLQEGYMLQTSGFAGTQHEIKNAIEELIGTEGLNNFYSAWLANYCTKQDIDSMAAWGFNSIRLPMHYNLFTLPIEDEPVAGQDTWIETGFEMVDELLDWCEANEVYLILDLHGAPGGQGKNASISDYDPSKPSLWESEENRRKTAALWRKLAKRYVNEPWMGAYDILNEPNWDLDKAGNENGCNCTENKLLWEFFDNVIEEIREVDQNHIVIIEGNCWGNNYQGMPDPNTFDDNLVVSFHKYWNYNKKEEIQWAIDMSEKYNVPIWLGESGENSNTWFTNAIHLVESNNIGWAWWPYKKIESVTGTVTAPKTEGYQRLLDYWNGEAPKPEKEQAEMWLMEQAEMLKLENCIIRYDVIDAMFRQAQGDKSAMPFKNHTIPGTIYAVDYDLGANNHAYFDTDTANYRTSTQENTRWNSGREYRNDGVDIDETDYSKLNGFYVGWINDGEWLKYTANVRKKGKYEMTITYAAENEGRFHLMINGKPTREFILKPTGGYNEWSTYTIEDVKLPKGETTLKLVTNKGGFNLGSLKFEK